jgi:hypothetical protein
MCAVSFVGDHFRDRWVDKPWFPQPPLMPPGVWPYQQQQGTVFIPQVTRAEFDELKREVLEIKDLLKRAKAYDEQTGQPDCEMDEKVDILRKVAQLVGVDIDDVLGKRGTGGSQAEKR